LETGLAFAYSDNSRLRDRIEEEETEAPALIKLANGDLLDIDSGALGLGSFISDSSMLFSMEGGAGLIV
jgi:hypothetical protein